MILELSKADFCQQVAPQSNAWRMTLNETVFIVAVAILLLKLLLLTFVTPEMTRELAHNDVGNRINSVNP